MGSFLSSLLFPPFCSGCQRIGTLLCPSCYERLQFIPLPLSLPLTTIHLSQITAAVEYQEPIKTMIHQLKYLGAKNIGKWCGSLLYYTTYTPPVDVITAVPIHTQKLRQRGYNQSEIIAQALAAHLQKPYYPLLLKHKSTASQAAAQSKETRVTQLADSFSLNQTAANDLSPKQRKVLIVDDVITTGTTLNLCAEVLLKHGFKDVLGKAVAHGQ